MVLEYFWNSFLLSIECTTWSHQVLYERKYFDSVFCYISIYWLEMRPKILSIRFQKKGIWLYIDGVCWVRAIKAATHAAYRSKPITFVYFSLTFKTKIIDWHKVLQISHSLCTLAMCNKVNFSFIAPTTWDAPREGIDLLIFTLHLSQVSRLIVDLVTSMFFVKMIFSIDGSSKVLAVTFDFMLSSEINNAN